MVRISLFHHSSVGKEFACDSGDPGSIPGSGRSPGEGKGYPLQYTGLENSMDYTVHGVAKRLTRLSDFTIQHMQTTFWASLVAQSVEKLPAVQETWFDSWVGKIPWRRKWQPTPVFLPGESHGQRSLVGYGSQSRKELDTTKVT